MSVDENRPEPAPGLQSQQPQPQPQPEPQPQLQLQNNHIVLQLPVDVRSVSLGVLAVLATVFALRWAADVFIPLLLSLLLTYALGPFVTRLERWHISRWIGSALILLGTGCAIGWTGYSLSGSAAALVESLPVAAQKLRLGMQLSNRPSDASPLDTVQKAATQLQQAADETAAKVAARKGVARVTIERPAFNVRDYVWTGTVGLVAAAGQLMLVTFLTFFALGSGSMFRRKLVKITGASLQKKKITVHVLDAIANNIERYLLMQILTSGLVGVATGLAFWALGFENAAVWGIIAGVTNLIPYLGSVVMMGAAGVVAFLQFNNVQMALLVAGSSLLIHTLVGNLLLPWLTGRSSRMNPVAVFVGVIFWGWLWGIPGLLLGIPIMMVLKAICDHVEDLRAFGELLGA